VSTTESFFSTVTSAGYGTAATAVTSASGATEIVVTPVSLHQARLQSDHSFGRKILAQNFLRQFWTNFYTTIFF
jgi:hypothetical protein